jgi:hypothetical protein
MGDFVIHAGRYRQVLSSGVVYPVCVAVRAVCAPARSSHACPSGEMVGLTQHTSDQLGASEGWTAGC